MTNEEIRQAGLEALFRELGPGGMARFLRQFELGQGDFTTERQSWLGRHTVAELAERIRTRRPQREADGEEDTTHSVRGKAAPAMREAGSGAVKPAAASQRMSTTETMSLEEIQRAGAQALRRELGLVGMVRFLQSLGDCTGDYTAERHEWLDKLDLDTIVERIRKRRQQPRE
jgi:hypothetical protein